MRHRPAVAAPPPRPGLPCRPACLERRAASAPPMALLGAPRRAAGPASAPRAALASGATPTRPPLGTPPPLQGLPCRPACLERRAASAPPTALLGAPRRRAGLSSPSHPGFRCDADATSPRW
ncbi:hypothetical protein BS78_10G151100 [Paspalum vaginatum]|nr:hypothetical protein BS78_10G151100 [Paspalum vaginatum]